MPRILILFFFGFIFLSSYNFTEAGLFINEIMYDLSGSDSTSSKSREWIEVYNNAAIDVAVDAGSWRIFDGSANRTINGEVNFSIPNGAYVIFAGDKDTFLSDHAGFTGTVYDTGITSLNNTGATLKILDQDGNAVDTVTYASGQGAAGDGNTLQKISSAWSGAVPTPGATNESTPPPGDSGSGGPSAPPSSESKIKPPEKEKIRTEIKAKTIGFTGAQIVFEAFAYGYNSEELHYGKYFWNFGDGDFRESQTSYGEKFPHTYFYPGEYTVSLEYFMNTYSEMPDATDTLRVKVIVPGVSISRVGDEKDFFIELMNDAEFDADISKWILSSDRLIFPLPKNTILAPKQKIMLSPLITNFNISDKDTLKLMTFNRELVYDYAAFSASAKTAASSAGKTTIAAKSAPKAPPQAELAIKESENSEIPSENLQASVINSEDDKDDISYIPIAAFLGLVGISSGALYFIRTRKNTALPGDDFELLDE